MSSGNEICWHFCTHHEALLYVTALYTLLKLKRYISVTHARRSFTHAWNHERSMRKECGGKNGRVKKWPTNEVWERYSYLRNEAIIRKTPNKFWSDHDTEPVSMTSLSHSCATSRLEPWTDTHTHTRQLQ